MSHLFKVKTLIKSGAGPECYINALQELIDAGINVEGSKRLLRSILAANARDPYLNQEIPDKPPTPEEERISQLQNTDLSIYDACDLENYYAVLSDYENQIIVCPAPGQSYYYYGGKRVTDQIDFPSFPLFEHVPAWIAAHGAGKKLWLESGYETMRTQLHNSATVAPSNDILQHMVWAEIPSQNGHLTILEFLDDTGADMALVFAQDDLPLLGIYPGGVGWGPSINILTAGGIVQRPTVIFHMRWLDNQGAPIDNTFFYERASVDPGRSTDPGAIRLSGMSMRRYLFTATAPDGIGLLYISKKRHDITSRLPVV